VRAAGIEPASSSVSSWRSAADLRAHGANDGTRTHAKRVETSRAATTLRSQSSRGWTRTNVGFLRAVNSRVLSPLGHPGMKLHRARSRNCTRGPSLTRRLLFWLSYAGKLVEPTAGIEPATFALRKRCTTVVLRGQSSGRGSNPPEAAWQADAAPSDLVREKESRVAFQTPSWETARSLIVATTIVSDRRPGSRAPVVSRRGERNRTSSPGDPNAVPYRWATPRSASAPGQT
jgi:hypothetical protein